MADELNVTYITLYGFVEMGRYRYLIFLIMFATYSLSLSFNAIIVYLIWIHRNLHEPMYIFIAALLLNSAITSTNVYPKMLIDILSEKGIISYSACLLQCYVHYSFSSSDFLLLAAMAYDRYVSICKPLQYTTIMSKNIVCIILAVAWILPLCEVAVPTILSSKMKLCTSSMKAIYCNNTYYSLYCGTSSVRALVDMCNIMNLVVAPIVFIVFTYTKIFIICNRSSRNVRKKAAQTCLPHLIILVSFSCMTLLHVTIIEVDVDSEVNFILILQVYCYYPLFNPVVYGLKVKEIFKHLKRLLCPVKII